MQITLAKLSEIHPYPKNARKIPQSAIDAVAKSIQEFGWQQPIVVDRDGVIIVGHCRLLAAHKLGLAEAPVHVAEHLTPAQVRQYRLMDNRSHEEAKWDMDILTAEMLELKALDLDLSLTGFSSGELDRMTRNPLDGEDDVPPVPECPVTRPGDLWVMGKHRVLCGDATEPEDVTRLLGGQVPFLMVTDPPYGVEYDPTWRQRDGLQDNTRQSGKVANDERADWAEAYRMFPGSVAYVWCGSWFLPEVMSGLLDAGFERRSLIIWAKQALQISRGHYHWQHEPCWYAVRKGHTAHWHGDRKQSTLWQVANLNGNGNRDEKATGHGTQKPVELMRRPILNHTVPGEAVYDPFLGSGTTLVACELTERVCFGIDIDAKYVDVIVTRWQNLTGKEATLGDGPHKGCTFAHAKHGRQLEGQDAILEEVLNGAS